MASWKSFFVLTLAVVWTLAGCSSNPTSPDVEMTVPDGSALALGEGMAVRGGSGGRGDGPIVFVTSQQLYYDSIVTADPVPMKGPFQRLYTTPDLHTAFGPGDRGYVGGRWWVDVNGDNMMNEGDHFFLCPLLGPGRDNP